MIRRYKLIGVTKAQMDSQIDPAWRVLLRGTSPVYKDVEFVGATGATGATGPPESTVEDLDDYMRRAGWRFEEVDPVESPSQLCIVQDFDAPITVDVSTTASPPNWGDLFLVPVTVGGTGMNRIKASCTASLFADGDPAVLRLALRDSQNNDVPLSHPAYVFSNQTKDLGSTSMSGSVLNVAPGDYHVVLQGNIVAGNLAIQAATDPADQGANISIQELCD